MMLEGIVSLFIILTVCLLATAGTPHAIDHIAVPEAFPPHPRLFLNQQEIDDLRAWAEREDWLGEYIDEFVAQCLIDAETVNPPTEDGGEGVNKELAEQAQNFALAYVLSDRPELAEAAAVILRGYADVYPTYGVSGMRGRATSSTLGEADWGRKIACAYDLIYNSDALSEADKQAIEDQVLRPCGEVLRTCNHAFRSNWRSAALSSFGVIGFCIGDRDLLAEALNGIRDESDKLIRDGFGNHLAWSMLTDGVFYERSMGYHHFSLSNYAYLLEAARHSDVDLWRIEITGSWRDAGADIDHRFGQTGPKTIRAMFDVPFYYMFGDATGASVANAKHPELAWAWFYEAAWRAYGDPKYAWIVNRREGARVQSPAELMWISPDLPEGRYDLDQDAQIGLTGRHVNACTLLPGGGYTILRQDGSRDAVGVLMTYGRYGSGHSHPDKLSIVLYAAGREYMPETNYFGYGHEDFLTWTNQTIAHSTVTVDEVAQAPQGANEDPWMTDWGQDPVHGRPIMFHAGEQLKAFRADSDSVYEGVVLDRTIVLVGSVLVDFFRCRSDAEHQYDYALHINAEPADCSPALSDPQAEPLSESFGYSHIINARRAALDGQAAELTYRAEDDEPSLHLSFMPAGPMELIVAAGAADLDGERMEMLILRATGRNVDFVGTMSFAAGDGRHVAVRRIEGLADGVLGVEITRPDGSKDIVLSADVAGTFEYAGQTITGQVALLRVSADGSAELVDTAE